MQNIFRNTCKRLFREFMTSCFKLRTTVYYLWDTNESLLKYEKKKSFQNNSYKTDSCAVHFWYISWQKMLVLFYFAQIPFRTSSWKFFGNINLLLESILRMMVDHFEKNNFVRNFISITWILSILHFQCQCVITFKVKDFHRFWCNVVKYFKGIGVY